MGLPSLMGGPFCVWYILPIGVRALCNVNRWLVCKIRGDRLRREIQKNMNFGRAKIQMICSKSGNFMQWGTDGRNRPPARFIPVS